MAKTNIIDEVITTKKGREIVRKMIPVMIRWAKNGETERTYRDLFHVLGYERFTAIGHQLYNVQAVLNYLSEEENVEIPTLNSLVKNSKTMLPSEGFEYVSPKYNDLDDAGKKVFVAGLDSEAVNYPYWDWVLEKLDLKPLKIFSDKELNNLAAHAYGSGGEGKEHRAIKEYICNHPESIDIKNVNKAETEYNLPSGDRLDVYFEQKDGTRIAVEVKPSTSPDEDITRGIFQCVKYKAVLDAIRYIRCDSYKNKVLLVTAGVVSDQNQQLADGLGVRYVENFEIE